MNKIKLKIRTETPCNFDIAEMTPNSNGYYCRQCDNNVIDMSDWNEENILEFFIKNPKNVCARIKTFHTERFLSERIDQTKKLSFSGKVIALLLTLLGLTSLSIKAQNKSISNIELKGNDKGIDRDSITIYGNISIDGIPESGVKVTFMGKAYYSDTFGNYQIILKRSVVRNGQIHFIHDSLPFQSRNYEISMESVRFDIVYKDYKKMLLKDLPKHFYTGRVIPEFPVFTK